MAKAYDIRNGSSSASFPKSVKKYMARLAINLGNTKSGNINFTNRKCMIPLHFSACRLASMRIGFCSGFFSSAKCLKKKET